MNTKELIKKLQDMVDHHESSGAIEIMGEHEIVIDCWDKEDSGWKYSGFSPNIEIQYSDDGVYPIITAKESWK